MRDHIKDHIKPILRRNPDDVNLAAVISNESSADLAISGIIPRSDDEFLAVKVSGVNKIL